MEQLVQNLKDGKMGLEEVPFPLLHEGSVLVRNHFSLISAGTEGKTVKDARSGYIAKARSRRDEVRKVIRSARTAGVMHTYRMVMNKLETLSPLGYCCAGEVIEVGPGISDLRVGDLVACGGGTANHSEVIAVSRNLCVKIPPGVPTEVAAMTTMGSIALQGIRQAEVQLGGNCVVIGLGLLGQMTMQLLQAAGVTPLGVDIDPAKVALANANDLHAMQREDGNLLTAVQQLSGGFGTDAVIITAGSDSTDPVDLAGELCRQKGKVVMVGASPAGFKRNNYFKKELDLRMSCSYGPGRYDREYEEQGIDYPIGYARWTENRNMEAFINLASIGKIEPGKLITHRFPFRRSPEAYDLVLDNSEDYLGILINYDLSRSPASTVSLKQQDASLFIPSTPAIGMIGAGSFATNILLPALTESCRRVALVTSKPADAIHHARKFRFESCPDNAESIFKNPDINTVIIATRHDSHFNYVRKALEHGKHVLVEKPLCLNEEELSVIRDLYIESGKKLMVGFNRRFAPLITQLKELLPSSLEIPVAVNYRINAGVVPGNHWIHDPLTGGGRIVGETCHFIDLCMFIARSPITSVSAVTMADTTGNSDTVTISLNFQNGSIANISYFSNGHPSVRKELLEVFFAGQVAVIDDFTSMKVSGNKSFTRKITAQDKGHSQSIRSFLQSIEKGTQSPIPFDEIYLSMLATFKTAESVRLNGNRIFLTS